MSTLRSDLKPQWQPSLPELQWGGNASIHCYGDNSWYLVAVTRSNSGTERVDEVPV